MVPSWTETLLHCGVDVVGRTRFCIHPEAQVREIPIVGGTKDWNWDQIVALNPDLILLDQEENPKFMAEQARFPWHATHITEVADMPLALEKMSSVLQSEGLKEVAQRWRVVCGQKPLQLKEDFEDLPGVLEWGIRPRTVPKQVLYMIWKNPWMCVSRNTFIGSVLALVGVQLEVFADKYPKMDLSQFNPEETLLLLSSEPYPFLKRKQEFANFEFPHAFVQGEDFSWFGVRSLEFLEQTLS